VDQDVDNVIALKFKDDQDEGDKDETFLKIEGEDMGSSAIQDASSKNLDELANADLNKELFL
jgi:hypothetical protein